MKIELYNTENYDSWEEAEQCGAIYVSQEIDLKSSRYKFVDIITEIIKVTCICFNGEPKCITWREQR